MTLNLGRFDRTARLVGAAVLVLVAVLVTGGALSWVLGAVALILLATSVVGTCPLYLPFGFSTRESAA